MIMMIAQDREKTRGKDTFLCINTGRKNVELPRPGDAIPPAGCFTRRSLPPIYIHGTVPPPTADERETESEPEDRAEAETALAESNHSIRPETEREQEDRDEIESDHFIQASPHDSGWTPG